MWEELIGDRATAKIGAAPLVPDDAVQEPGSNEDDQQLPNNRDYLESVPAVISFEIYPVFPRKVHFGTIQFDHGKMKILHAKRLFYEGLMLLIDWTRFGKKLQ